MNCSKHFFLVTLLLVSSAHIFSSAGRDISTNTYTCCIGNCVGVTCQAGTANAIGDKKQFKDLAGVAFNDLGTVSVSREIELPLPTQDASVGHKVIFSFGELAHTPLKFLTRCKKQDDGMMHYTFYRQLPDEVVWTEVGSLYAENPLSTIKPVVASDGALVTVEGEKKIGIIFTATKALNVPKEAKRKIKLK